MPLSLPGLKGLPKIPTARVSLPTPKLSLPPMPSLSTDSIVNAIIDARAKMVSTFDFRGVSADSKELLAEDMEPKEGTTAPLESVYIVLRPLNLRKATDAYLQRLGRLVETFEFQRFLLVQHWGVLIGDRYYHLHIDDATQKMSVSMVPFVEEHARHTLKIPIWRTRFSHDERVGIAVGLIKAMGGFKTDAEVDITDESGHLVTAPDVRERYHVKGRYIPWPLVQLFGGKYHPLSNNCIHFTFRYIFHQLLPRPREMRNFAANLKWLVAKWRAMGCKRGPAELAKSLSGILGTNRSFLITPEQGAKLLIKLLSIFLDIDYNAALDNKLPSNSPQTIDEVVEQDAGVEVQEQSTEDLMKLPIPESVEGSEALAS